jgi:CBS domain-containing protein
MTATTTTAAATTTAKTPIATRLAARDVMSRDLVTVPEDLTVREALELLIDHEISGAPVEDREGRLLGVVSLADIARASAEEGGFEVDRSNPLFAVRAWGEHFEPGEFAGLRLAGESRPVREIMTPAVYTAGEDTPVAGVAAAMVDGHIHRVLVTRDGRAVGVISSLDLIKLLLDRGPRV